MLLSMVFYATAAEVLAPPLRKAPDPVFLSVLAVAAAAMVGIAVWVQIARVRPALQNLQLKPDDSAALQRWRGGTIMACVMLEAVVLYGFVLRFMGGTFLQSLPFYCVGVLLTVFYWPQRP